MLIYSFRQNSSRLFALVLAIYCGLNTERSQRKAYCKAASLDLSLRLPFKYMYVYCATGVSEELSHSSRCFHIHDYWCLGRFAYRLFDSIY